MSVHQGRFGAVAHSLRLSAISTTKGRTYSDKLSDALPRPAERRVAWKEVEALKSVMH